MIGVILTSLVSQYAIFFANSLKSPSLVMPLGYASVILGFWADVYLFGNTFSFFEYFRNDTDQHRLTEWIS